MKKLILTIILCLPLLINAKEINIDWQKEWGDFGDSLAEIVKTSDGGYIAVGEYNSGTVEGLEIDDERNSSALIIKFNQDGNVVWQKTYGGNSFDTYDSVIEDKDGSFIAVGYTSSDDLENITLISMQDALIVKYDKNGNIIWEKNWGGEFENSFDAVTLTSDNGYVAVGYTDASSVEDMMLNGRSDAIIVKYNKDGQIVWQNNFGGSRDEFFLDVKTTNDGGYIAVGNSFSNDFDIQNKGVRDGIIVKFNQEGNKVWSKNWGGDNEDTFLKVGVNTNNELITLARANSSDIVVVDGEDMYAINKYSENGELIFSNLIPYKDITLINFDILTDEEYVFVGYTKNTDMPNIELKSDMDAIIMISDKEGNINIIDNLAFGPNNSLWGIECHDINNFIVTGSMDKVRILNYELNFILSSTESEKGTYTLEQSNNLAIIKPTPDKGYEVDTITIKDKEGNIIDVEIISNQDGTYSFPLHTDVSVEVTFKEKIENPKTGILDLMTILIIGFIISVTGFFLVKNYNERFEI